MAAAHNDALTTYLVTAPEVSCPTRQSVQRGQVFTFADQVG